MKSNKTSFWPPEDPTPVGEINVMSTSILFSWLSFWLVYQVPFPEMVPLPPSTQRGLRGPAPSEDITSPPLPQFIVQAWAPYSSCAKKSFT